MSRLFGTDGIRGIYNKHPITQEIASRLGYSIVRFCKNQNRNLDIIIGRDTRGSGKVLEYALVSGILSAGGNVRLPGVMPTPGVAYLTRSLRATAGIVLSASHNPHEYNGFKIFSSEGYKLSEKEESAIEEMVLKDSGSLPRGGFGRVDVLEQARDKYVSFLIKTIPQKLRDIKIVIDCANGATFRVAPSLFKKLGLRSEYLFVTPDGKNINLNCGSQHTETLSRRVLESGADLGLAFDGDGDRLIAVDEKGSRLTGDQVITICAKMMKEKKELKNDIVVSTVMSNMGLGSALKEMEIDHVASAVGDRFVVEEMKKRNSVLGGEDSGHIIFLNHHTTGDGLLTALQLLYAVTLFNRPLSELSTLMTIYPQTLINVPVKKKPDFSLVPEIFKVIREAESKLGDEGRILVRYSGTEPLCRVMVEGKRKKDIEEHARVIAEVVSKELNA